MVVTKVLNEIPCLIPSVEELVINRCRCSVFPEWESYSLVPASETGVHKYVFQESLKILR
jgi:hypothetical protein